MGEHRSGLLGDKQRKSSSSEKLTTLIRAPEHHGTQLVSMLELLLGRQYKFGILGGGSGLIVRLQRTSLKAGIYPNRQLRYRSLGSYYQVSIKLWDVWNQRNLIRIFNGRV